MSLNESNNTLEMNFSPIFIALLASIFAEPTVKLVKCLQRANNDANLSYDCLLKAIKKEWKSEDRLYSYRSLIF